MVTWLSITPTGPNHWMAAGLCVTKWIKKQTRLFSLNPSNILLNESDKEQTKSLLQRLFAQSVVSPTLYTLQSALLRQTFWSWGVRLASLTDMLSQLRFYGRRSDSEGWGLPVSQTCSPKCALKADVLILRVFNRHHNIMILQLGSLPLWRHYMYIES